MTDQSERFKVDVNDIAEHFKNAALEYHRKPTPGKIAIVPTKGLINQRDMALAYSPGVAEACNLIVANPAALSEVTARGNLVAVISNGTAVLGLGDIGPLASKPVMEGKAVLFKKFANIDVFDLEINEKDPDRLIDIIASLEPTFGGINLEDIKAPECFYIERELRKRMKIPVFHDDQHGTAIVVGAAVLNGLTLVNKKIEEVKLVCSGAGAAALSCLGFLIKLGLKREHVWVFDKMGFIHQGRSDLPQEVMDAYARAGSARPIAEVLIGADVFLGLSAAGVLSGDKIKGMAPDPLILALANPTPEIMPAEVLAARSDAIVATGRSDYPNQVNNVLCFPYIFRGALDVEATTITDEMMLAAARAIAELARAESTEEAVKASGGEDLIFGRHYLIPKPFDPRLITKIAPAVAKAAAESEVARRPLVDAVAYQETLSHFIYHSGFAMKPVYAAAKRDPKRVFFADGEDDRVLRAVQIALDEGLCQPILAGRREVIERNAKNLGLKLLPGKNIEVAQAEDRADFESLWTDYHLRLGRHGVNVGMARQRMRFDTTLLGAMLLRRGEVDAMLCGLIGDFERHLRHVMDNIDLDKTATCLASMNMLLLPNRTVFISDAYVNENPDAEQIAEITLLAAEEVRRFGVTPKVALLSHSNFGSLNSQSAQKMRRARAILEKRAPQLEVDGEMHGDVALQESIREALYRGCRLKGEANLLMMPNIDAAHISFNLLKVVSGDNITVGPILLGAARSVHVLTPTATVRRLLNMTALAVADVPNKQPVGG